VTDHQFEGIATAGLVAAGFGFVCVVRDDAPVASEKMMTINASKSFDAWHSPEETGWVFVVVVVWFNAQLG
jgi:hypothetical protein